MLNYYPFLLWWLKNGRTYSSYIKKSTTLMSRPTRTQMISPSPTCTRRHTTPRTRRSAPTVMSRGLWTRGNLEGQKWGTGRQPQFKEMGFCIFPTLVQPLDLLGWGIGTWVWQYIVNPAVLTSPTPWQTTPYWHTVDWFCVHLYCKLVLYTSVL